MLDQLAGPLGSRGNDGAAVSPRLQHDGSQAFMPRRADKEVRGAHQRGYIVAPSQESYALVQAEVLRQLAQAFLLRPSSGQPESNAREAGHRLEQAIEPLVPV